MSGKVRKKELLMKIIRAKIMGFCSGVRRAVQMAYSLAQQGPITLFGPLVHNQQVLAQLQALGAEICQDPSQIRTRRVLTTAHGLSYPRRLDLERRGLEIIDTTCPLVYRVHQAIARFLRMGLQPLLFGERGHSEAQAVLENYPATLLVSTLSDIQNLPPLNRIGIACQTTMTETRVAQLFQAIRARFPKAEIRLEDTICGATKQRQRSAIAIARQSDVVVVVGGRQSKNTRELVETCRQYCPRVLHIESAKELHPDLFEGAKVVGLTAGASTPEESIQEVENWLQTLSMRTLVH